MRGRRSFIDRAAKMPDQRIQSAIKTLADMIDAPSTVLAIQLD